MALGEVFTQWRRLASGVSQYDVERHKELTNPEPGEAPGFSMNPYTGRRPQHGYMVGQHPSMGGVEHTHPIRELTPQHIAEHRTQALQKLHQPDMYQGGWATDDGRAVLDVAHNIQDHDKAISEGQKHQQEAIWGLDNSKEIKIPARVS